MDLAKTNHQLRLLTAQVAELLEQTSNLQTSLSEVWLQNDQLKAKETNGKHRLDNVEKKIHEIVCKTTKLQEKVLRVEKEALEKQVANEARALGQQEGTLEKLGAWH